MFRRHQNATEDAEAPPPKDQADFNALEIEDQAAPPESPVPGTTMPRTILY